MKGKKAGIVLVPRTTVTVVTLLHLNPVLERSIFILIKGKLRDLFSSSAIVAYFLQLLLIFFHTLSLLMLFLCCNPTILRAVKTI